MYNTARAAGILLCIFLGGCAVQTGAPRATHYRCANAGDFTASLAEDAAVLDTAQGRQMLDRDAGGVGEQTVYSNAGLRAEFGLGPAGREAVLRYLPQGAVLRCVRD